MAGENLTKPELKELARRVVVAQGNSFIKELLRNNDAKIGATKEEFAANLDDAIENDIIDQQKMELWLKETEGWGDQHLYVLQPPAIDSEALAAGIAASPHANLLHSVASLGFPDVLELKHITLDNSGISMVWHQSKEGWNRWRPKDFAEEVEFERYRFEAFRQRFDRSVVRYEWQFKDPYSAVLIHRNTEIDHETVFDNVRTALVAIGVPDLRLAWIPLNQAVKVAATKDKGMHSTRFELDSGYVEMASTLAEGGIESVEPVRLVLQSVDTAQFDGAQGMLHFAAEEHGISRRVAVQVFGSEVRLRIWAQCKRDDVFQLLSLLWGYNSEQ